MTPGQEFAPKVRATVNGVAQKPIEGVSMAYSFDDAEAAERHETQYFEVFGKLRHFSQRLGVGDQAPDAVGDRTGQGGGPRRQLGAVQHGRGLESGERPGETLGEANFRFARQPPTIVTCAELDFYDLPLIRPSDFVNSAAFMRTDCPRDLRSRRQKGVSG